MTDMNIALSLILQISRCMGLCTSGNNQTDVVKELNVARKTMPNVKGMGLKDALYLLENMNLKVAVKGRGKW